LLKEHEGNLGEFLTIDPKGRQLPAFLGQLSEYYLTAQKTTLAELETLQENIGHIRDIVTMQQNYAKVSGIKEIVSVSDLVEDSLRMNDIALVRHHIEVVREFEEVPPVNTDKHKVLQILVNLIRNAKYACEEAERPGGRLTLRVRNVDGRVEISVKDNGVGIPPENLTRIFNHGFTTRKDGHGFGLHSSALAAKEIGGSLRVQSDGPGQGAIFTLELPLETADTNP
jgi:signal transduction histidine kinase